MNDMSRMQTLQSQDIPSDWRRRPGRPQQSWLGTIHRDLRKLDIDLDNVLNLLPIIYCGVR